MGKADQLAVREGQVATAASWADTGVMAATVLVGQQARAVATAVLEVAGFSAAGTAVTQGLAVQAPMASSRLRLPFLKVKVGEV